MSANSQRWSREPRRDLGWVTWIAAPLALGVAAALAVIIVARSLAEAPEAASNTTTAAQPGAPTRTPLDGRELFAREWQPRDPRAHGGDGLGPLFNDTSCVACHNQGGIGGGGSRGRNVNIVTTQRITAVNQAGPGGPQVAGTVATVSFVLHHSGTDSEFAGWRQTIVQSGAFGGAGFGGMGEFTPGAGPFGPGPGLTAQSIESALNSAVSSNVFVFPGSTVPAPPGAGQGGVPAAPPGADPAIPAPVSQPAMPGLALITQRNATALFGAGRIDSLDEQTLEAAAARKFHNFPEVTGRVSRTKEGKFARFGWKAQISGLEEFVLTACAVELGLQVPGHEQPALPYKRDYKAPGLDMDRAECNELVSFVSRLPAPARQPPEPAAAAKYVREGEELFTAVGCATCHVPKLADVDGIFSDLLLHDMGDGLNDAATSYGLLRPESQHPTPPDSVPADSAPAPRRTDLVNGRPRQPIEPATSREWRTPPLWGVRDSAPYLHDGRAETLEAAVAAHGGEAERSRVCFAALTAEDQQKLVGFLKTLVAPTN